MIVASVFCFVVLFVASVCKCDSSFVDGRSTGVAKLEMADSVSSLSLVQLGASVMERSGHTAGSRIALVPYLSHSTGAVAFLQRTLMEGCAAWSDRPAVYTGVPREMVGATFFAGKRGGIPPGNLVLSSSVEGCAYIWGNNATQRRNPNLVQAGWSAIGTLRIKGGDQFRVYRKRLTAGLLLEVPLHGLWVGGVAFKKSEASQQASSSNTSVANLERTENHDISLLNELAEGGRVSHKITQHIFQIVEDQLDRRIVKHLSLNCNTAAFGFAIVLLAGLAASFCSKACWAEVTLAIERADVHTSTFEVGGGKPGHYNRTVSELTR